MSIDFALLAGGNTQMKKPIIWLLLSLVLPTSAWAQTSPGFSYGQVPTAGEWNSAFAQKQDYLGFLPLNSGGGSMTGKLNLVPSSSGSSGLNLGLGLPPGSPSNGDVWMTTAGLFYQVGGATIGPLGSGGGGGGSNFVVQQDKLTVTSTNVVSALTKSWGGGLMELVVNGVGVFNYGASPPFTVFGSVITWNASNAGYNLNTNYSVVAIYAAVGYVPPVVLGSGVSVALQTTTNASGGLVTYSGSLGTPAQGVLTNATGLPLSSGVTGVLPPVNGGTGAAALTGILVGNGTSAATAITPGSGVATALTQPVNTTGGLGVVGTSGANVPLLNVANTWGAMQTFSGLTVGQNTANATSSFLNATVLNDTTSLTIYNPSTPYTSTTTYAGLLANLGANLSIESLPTYSSNAIAGMVVQTNTSSLSFPTAVTGVSVLKAAGNTAFGMFAQCYQFTTGACIGAEFNTFNEYQDANATFPDVGGYPDTSTEPNALQLVAYGGYTAKAALNIAGGVSLNGAGKYGFQAGIYIAAGAANAYGIFIDANSVVGPGQGIRINSVGGSTGQSIVMSTETSATSAFSFMTAYNFGGVKFSVDGVGDMLTAGDVTVSKYVSCTTLTTNSSGQLLCNGSVP